MRGSATWRWRALGAALCASFVACGRVPKLDTQVAQNCVNYCALTQMRCRQAQTLYRDTASCLAACAELPAQAPQGESQGNSLQCRMTYLMATTPHNARTFCQNAGASGGTACVGATP